MICICGRFGVFASAFGVLLTVLPVHAAGLSGAPSDDDGDEARLPTAAADFNRDGIADMVTANMPAVAGASAQGFLTVLLGQKDGTYLPMATSPAIGPNPKSIVVGDFNGDGIPDLIVGDGDGSLTEFLGDGTGKLVQAGVIGRVGSVVSIARGDFNHDGILDLAVSDLESGSVSILIGKRDGSFQIGWAFSYEKPGTAAYLTAADFNGDGRPDLAVTNAEGEMIEVMLGNGNGTFTESAELRSVKDPYSHCAT